MLNKVVFLWLLHNFDQTQSFSTSTCDQPQSLYGWSFAQMQTSVREVCIWAKVKFHRAKLESQVNSTNQRRPTQYYQVTWPKPFQVARVFFSDKEAKWIFIGIFECDEYKYDILFLAGTISSSCFWNVLEKKQAQILRKWQITTW